MKQLHLFMVFMALIIAGCQTAKETDYDVYMIPDLMKTGENGVISQELIYPLDNKPTPECALASGSFKARMTIYCVVHSPMPLIASSDLQNSSTFWAGSKVI